MHLAKVITRVYALEPLERKDVVRVEMESVGNLVEQFDTGFDNCRVLRHFCGTLLLLLYIRSNINSVKFPHHSV
jgi:hypothetical protein